MTQVGTRGPSPYTSSWGGPTRAPIPDWLGEDEGLRVSLAGAEDKLTQTDRRSRNGATVGSQRRARNLIGVWALVFR
jgi:hypothetical protein